MIASSTAPIVTGSTQDSFLSGKSPGRIRPDAIRLRIPITVSALLESAEVSGRGIILQLRRGRPDPRGERLLVGEGWRNEISGGDAANVVQAGTVGAIHFTQAALRAMPRPQQLPPPPSGFVNREAELDVLNGLLSQDIQGADSRTSIIVITGMPGIGKTSLALSWAERVRENFPDGSLYVNLHGYDTGLPASAVDVLDYFLRALDVPVSQLPAGLEALTGLYRSVLYHRRALVILDNARTAEQVRPLLPPSSCLVLVTSRSRLPGLVAREGAARLPLAPLPPVHAQRILTRTITGPLAESESLAAATLAAQCAYLPLALRIVAERVAESFETGISGLTDEIGTERIQLDAYASVFNDESTEVRSVFSWSYHGLPPQAARMFRLLGLHAGPTASSAAAAALAGVPLADARLILGMLADLNLLERAGRDHYVFHDLLRAYAAERAQAEETPGNRTQAVGRLISWYLYVADAADRLLAPNRRHVLPDAPESDTAPPPFRDYETALAWCEAERQSLVATVNLAAANGHDDQAWKLAMALVTFFHLRKYRADRLATCQVALASARRIGDQTGEAWSMVGIGGALNDLHRPEEAITLYRESLDVWRAIGDGYGEGMALTNLSEAFLDSRQFDEALEYGERALVLAREVGDRRGEAIRLTMLGRICHDLGRSPEAVEYYQQALGVGHDVDQYNDGQTLHLLGNSLQGLGQLPEAGERFHQALLLQREIGDRYGEAETLRSLAGLQRQLGDLTGARQSLDRALSIFRALGDPQAAIAQRELDQLPDDRASDD